MDCARQSCGLHLQPREDGMYYDGDVIVCARCGTVNQIEVDDDGTSVSSWTCAHLVHGDEGCATCDQEDEAVVVGPVVKAEGGGVEA